MSKDVVPIHGADHCPGGPDEIPCLGARVFRAVQWNVLLSTPAGTDMQQLFFDYWSNPDPGIFNVNLDGSGNLASVDLLVPGYITATLLLNWGASFDASVAGMIDDGEGLWSPPGSEHTRKMRAGYNTGLDYETTLTRYYPTVNWELGHGGFELPTFACYAGQASGVSRNVQGRIDIAYFAAVVGETPS